MNNLKNELNKTKKNQKKKKIRLKMRIIKEKLGNLRIKRKFKKVIIRK